MRLNAKELIADARVTAATLPPAAAKLMTEMANRLDVQFAALCESRDQVKQLAAENVALKSNLMFWDAEDPESTYDHPDEIASEGEMDYGTEFTVQVAARMPSRVYRVVSALEHSTEVELVEGGEVKTPATDAAIASLRAEAMAQGLDEMAATYRNWVKEEDCSCNMKSSYNLTAERAESYAAYFRQQLRSQSAPSPEAAAIARQFEQVKGMHDGC